MPRTSGKTRDDARDDVRAALQSFGVTAEEAEAARNSAAARHLQAKLRSSGDVARRALARLDCFRGSKLPVAAYRTALNMVSPDCVPDDKAMSALLCAFDPSGTGGQPYGAFLDSVVQDAGAQGSKASAASGEGQAMSLPPQRDLFVETYGDATPSTPAARYYFAASNPFKVMPWRRCARTCFVRLLCLECSRRSTKAVRHKST